MKGLHKGKRLLALLLALCLCLGLAPAALADDSQDETGEPENAGVAPVIYAVEQVTDDVTVPIYLDYENYSFDERAADLIARMTLTEKRSQLTGVPMVAIPRLGVRMYNFWNEALHGMRAVGGTSNGSVNIYWNTTSYPISLSMSSSWDPELMYEVATLIGDEAREVVPDNDRMLTFFSPTVNLNRDPRWGRNDESFGEDPYLAAMMATEFVKAMEGKDRDGNVIDENGYLKTITTLKHYLANNSENNRLNGSSNISEQELREYYSYVYRLIIEDSDVSSVMSSYNRVNEVPVPVSHYLFDTLLRQTFGFSGYVVSDCDSVGTVTTSNQYGYGYPGPNSTGTGHRWFIPAEYTDNGVSRAMTDMEATAWAITAGGDVECNGGYESGNGGKYVNNILGAIENELVTPSGLFDENAVDISLLRAFSARMSLGEFDSQQGVVSWYNEARERIEDNYPDGWVYNRVSSADPVTMTEERLAKTVEAAEKSLVLLQNDHVSGTESPLLPLDISKYENIAVIGYLANPTPTTQNYFWLGGYSTYMGAPAYGLMSNPYEGLKSVIEAANPQAEVSYYKGFTGGTTAATLNNVDPAAVAAAAEADLCIVYVGGDNTSADEARDNTSINLPGAQASLAAQVVKANPNTVVVMEHITIVDITAFEDAPAIVWSCYNGQSKGVALANVLLGESDMTGRTSMIWYKNNDDLIGEEVRVGNQQTGNFQNWGPRSYRLSPGTDPEYGETPGRTYMYYDESIGGPIRYPFGYGLSYTSFAYSNLQVGGLSNDTIHPDESITVSVDVTNTGERAGSEVVQLYFATPDAPEELTLPLKRLRGFEKVTLQPGETTTVTLEVDIADLAYFDETQGKFVAYNGTYEAQISRNSSDDAIELGRQFTVSGSITPNISVVTVKANQQGDTERDIPQRVIFDLDQTVNPQITVAMNDDTLYGYIMKGMSTDIPDDFSISYSSNRPEIVEVDGDVITTKAPGVATITVTVEDSVSSGTADFIVYVKSEDDGELPYATSASVSGQNVEAFNPNVYIYNVAVPEGANPADYVIQLVPGDSSWLITYTQASSIPGTATAVISGFGGSSATYTFNFVVQDDPDTELPYISELNLNGLAVSDADFQSDVFEYDVAVPDGMPASSFIYSATPGRSSWTVTYSQLTEIPGTATITVTNTMGSVVYSFHYTYDTEIDIEDMFRIRVDDEDLADYRYAVQSYTYPVPNGRAIPTVSAQSVVAGMQPTVIQATALFESARVTFGGGESARTYLITFVPESTTRFDSLPGDWEILNGTGAETYASYGMTVPASRLSSGNDFPSVSMQNMLQYTGSLDGDWEVTLKVTGDRPLGGVGNYANYGIGLNNTGDGSGNNHLKLVQLNSGSNSAYQYTAGFSSNNTHSTFNYTTAWLRLVKEGSSYTGLISSDGVSFTTIRTINDTAGALDGAKLQLFVTGNQSASVDLNATFEYINMEMEGDTPDPDLATITFRVSPEDAEVEVYDSGNELVEPSSNPLVYELESGSYHYTVSAEGYLSESAGFEVSGDATITVELEPEEEIVEPESIEITGSLSVKRGRTTQLTLVVEPEGAVARGVTWELLTPGVAEIDNNGLLTAGSQPGIVVVMATTENGLSAQFVLQITA